MSFDSIKSNILKSLADGVDFSPKGSIDKPCLALVNFINDHLVDYVTTSSCSGRVSVFRDEGAGKGVAWLLVEHGIVTVNEIKAAVERNTVLQKGYGQMSIDENGSGVVMVSEPDRGEFSHSYVGSQEALVNLKCEGFILHVRCRDIESGRQMHHIARSCGYRESGLTISNKGVMLAIRTTAFALETPIAKQRTLLVDEQLLTVLVKEVNYRIRRNFERISKFLYNVKTHFGYPRFHEISVIPTLTSTTAATTITASQDAVQRWGHVAIAVDSENHRLVCIGGQGGPGARRAIPAIVVSCSTSGSDATISTVATSGASASSQIEVVHSDALESIWQVKKGVQFAILSGGRHSPKAAQEALRIVRIRASCNDSVLEENAEGRGIQISCISVTNTGDVPQARWGHNILALDTSDESGEFSGHLSFGKDKASCRRLFLHGGRDNSNVFSDSYVALLVASEEKTGEQEWSCTCHWQRLKGVENSDRIFVKPRFFAAAATLESIVVPSSKEGGHALHATICVQGGLSSIGVCPAKVHGDFTLIKVCWGISSVFDDSSSSGSASATVHELMDMNQNPLATVPRFGHTLTYIGAQTLLLLGGSAFGPEDGDDFEGSMSYNMTGLNAFQELAQQKHNLFPPMILHYMTYKDSAHENTMHCAAMDTIESASELGWMDDLRCHHRSLYVPCRRSSPATLTLYGGGLHILAFGPKYCPLKRFVVTAAQANAGASNDLGSYSNSTQIDEAALAAVRTDSAASSDKTSDKRITMVVVPTVAVKQVKVFLEFSKWLDKSNRIISLTPGSPSFAVAKEIYEGDIDSYEEVNSASTELQRKSDDEYRANSGDKPDTLKFSRLFWLGIHQSQQSLMVPLHRDSEDPLSKRQTRKQKENMKASVHVPSDKITKEARKDTDKEKYSAIPVNFACIQWLRKIDSHNQMHARVTQSPPEEKAMSLFSRSQTPYIPLFIATSSKKHSSQTGPISKEISTSIKRDKQLADFLCSIATDKANKNYFPDPVSACSTKSGAVPRKWEMVGDILMLPEGAFTSFGWEKLLPPPPSPIYDTSDVSALTACNHTLSDMISEDRQKQVDGFWMKIASHFGEQIHRVARRAKVDSGPRRESHILLLLPAVGRPALPRMVNPNETLMSTSKLCEDDGSIVPTTQKFGKLTTLNFSGENNLTDILPRSPGWCTVVENGIKFSFDITRIMFCSGNVTERMRMGRQVCDGQVVVDLYSGIGYYTIPFLVHGNAAHVHALEWNPFSVASLRHNLAQARIPSDRYSIYEGDNRMSILGKSSLSPTFPSPYAHTVSPKPPTAPESKSVLTPMHLSLQNIAHRVCCGLLPSSGEGWELAVRVLNKESGGIIHVHENVAEADVFRWAQEDLIHAFTMLFSREGIMPEGTQMCIACNHIEIVKNYAPRVVHAVVDLQCSVQQTSLVLEASHVDTEEKDSSIATDDGIIVEQADAQDDGSYDEEGSDISEDKEWWGEDEDEGQSWEQFMPVE